MSNSDIESLILIDNIIFGCACYALCYCFVCVCVCVSSSNILRSRAVMLMHETMTIFYWILNWECTMCFTLFILYSLIHPSDDLFAWQPNIYRIYDLEIHRLSRARPSIGLKSTFYLMFWLWGRQGSYNRSRVIKPSTVECFRWIIVMTIKDFRKCFTIAKYSSWIYLSKIPFSITHQLCEFS